MNRKFAALLVGLLASTSAAHAAPMGTFSFFVEVQGPPGDNQYCTRITSFANQTYDVFGVSVNLDTDVGEIVCTGSTVGGVAQGHCESYPSSSAFSFDFTLATICNDPPSCLSLSFITSSTSNPAGTLAAALGADKSYVVDGETTGGTPGTPASGIPGCPLTGTVTVLNGTGALNAFQTQTTPTGTNQTASFPQTTFFNPLTGQEVAVDIALTFGEVSSAGTTTVTASSNASGAIPSNFAAGVNGFQAAFLSITTTATLSPPIDVCSTYPDVDDDGFLDGTSPAVPEAALSFLHGEGDPVEFVDRTYSRDPVNNVICARVDSLSPFAVLVRTDGICANVGDPCDDGDACTSGDICNGALECVGPGAVDCDDGNPCTADSCPSAAGCANTPDIAPSCNASNGKALLLIRDSSDDAKDQVLFKWLKGTASVADFGMPTSTTAYTLCISDADEVLASATVPAGGTCGSKPCWKFVGPTATPNGVKYTDPATAAQGVKLINGKAPAAGRATVMVKALGGNVAPLDIASLDYPVTVQVRTSDAACWEHVFVEADEKKNDGVLFKAVHTGP